MLLFICSFSQHRTYCGYFRRVDSERGGWVRERQGEGGEILNVIDEGKKNECSPLPQRNDEAL